MTVVRPFVCYSATRHAGDEDLCPHAPPSSPRHPVQRTRYEGAHRKAAVPTCAVDEEHAEGGDAFASLATVTASGDQPTGCESKSTAGSSPKTGEFVAPREAHADAPEPRSCLVTTRTALPSRPTSAPLCSSSCQEPSPKPSDSKEQTPPTPERAGTGRSVEDEGSPKRGVDIYGRRLDRSFRVPEDENGPSAAEECYTIAADTASGDDQYTRVDRVARAEWRAEAAEAAARKAETASAAAASEARTAIDEAERLRAEGVELSRWREAVLNLRDVLEIAQREGKVGKEDDGEGRRPYQDGGCFQWEAATRHCSILLYILSRF